MLIDPVISGSNPNGNLNFPLSEENREFSTIPGARDVVASRGTRKLSENIIAPNALLLPGRKGRMSYFYHIAS